MERTTTNTRLIHAAPEVVYEAFTNPGALAEWLAPQGMTGKVHDFDLYVGGGYKMSLFYTGKEYADAGKSNTNEDRFTARFIELSPNSKIVQAINFDTDTPEYAGEMIMDVTLAREGDDTKVTIVFRNIPTGIALEDNEAGTDMSLEKLAKYVEQ